MNRNDVERSLKACWKSYKVGMITKEQYLRRRQRLLKCEESCCSKRSVGTISIYVDGKKRPIFQYRACQYHIDEINGKHDNDPYHPANNGMVRTNYEVIRDLS